MEKVKITAERADAIESYLSREHFVKDDLIEEHFDRRGKWDNEFFALNEMSSYALAKALYIGYEVEPEYKSFEEAMKALKDGKEVELHNDDGHEAFINRALWDEPIDELTISNFSFKDLLNGKWTIEKD